MSTTLVHDRHEIRHELGSSLARMMRSRVGIRADLLTWGKRFFPHYFKLKPGKHHSQIADKLKVWSRKRGVRVALKSPRASAKSTLLTFLYPIWSVCEETEDYIIILADVHGQAVKHLEGIKYELANNEELASAYPMACGESEEWNKTGIVTRNGVRVEPLGAGQKIRGRRQREDRPSLIIVDDPEGDEAAYSSVSRETIRQWATKAVFKAGSPKTNILVAGTVIHRECLVEYCSTLPGWRTLAFKSIVEWPDRMDLWQQWELILNDSTIGAQEAETEARDFYKKHRQDMDAGAKVLWPELENLYALMYIRATEGHTSFESEKQNNPIDPSKCEWEPSLFEHEDIWFDEWPKDTMVRTMALDPSKGKRAKSGDYQAIIMLGVDPKGVLYIDCDMRRQTMQDMVSTFVNLSREFRPDIAVVEDEQFQELLVPELENEAVRQSLIVPVEGISTENKPKPLRIRRLSSYVSRRRIKFKRRSPGAALCRRQMMDFPNADHDDGPDAMEMAVRKAVELLADTDRGPVESPY